MLLVYIIVIPGVIASHQEQRPRIISGPSHPIIGKKQGNLTFDWTFKLLPGRTWIESVEHVAFGFWKPPGYLKTKLIVIGKNGEVMIRQNQQSKISCAFNMSLLQVAFTVHDLGMGDENEYGLHVELGLARKPLIDVVTLLLEDPPKIVRPPKRNIYLRTGEELSLNCKATGLPRPQVTWERFGRVVRNHSILLGRVNKNDSGLYLCKAKSSAGEDSMKIFVRVEDKEKPTVATVSVSDAAISQDKSHEWRTVILVASLSGLIVLVSLAVFTFYCRRRKRSRKSNAYESLQENTTTTTS